MPKHIDISDGDPQREEMQKALDAVIAAEQRKDARENVTTWLQDAIRNTTELLTSLERAHRDSCGTEPVTAIVILPLIRDAVAMRDKLRELQEVR